MGSWNDLGPNTDAIGGFSNVIRFGPAGPTAYNSLDWINAVPMQFNSSVFSYDYDSNGAAACLANGDVVSWGGYDFSATGHADPQYTTAYAADFSSFPGTKCSRVFVGYNAVYVQDRTHQHYLDVSLSNVNQLNEGQGAIFVYTAPTGPTEFAQMPGARANPPNLNIGNATQQLGWPQVTPVLAWNNTDQEVILDIGLNPRVGYAIIRTLFHLLTHIKLICLSIQKTKQQESRKSTPGDLMSSASYWPPPVIILKLN